MIGNIALPITQPTPKLLKTSTPRIKHAQKENIIEAKNK
jgi:hypothetical protein